MTFTFYEMLHTFSRTLNEATVGAAVTKSGKGQHNIHYTSFPDPRSKSVTSP